MVGSLTSMPPGLLVASGARLHHNSNAAELYELAVAHEGATLSASGALATFSGKKTGRSPKEKRIVDDPATRGDIWWGSVNIPLSDHTFLLNRQRALDYFQSCPRLYVVDGFVGWDPAHRLKVRVLCTLGYHALFMRNMLIVPTPAEQAAFGEPDFVIVNAGATHADPEAEGNGSTTSVALQFERREMVILGTLYAGEMKKGIFTLMNYLMPRRGVLSMHCSANEGSRGDVSLFFGLSGTGKTTLSADPRRRLIGDDEHGWTDDGVFNIEGGCYAKCIGLTEHAEPQIFRAIRFGTVLENVVLAKESRIPDYRDRSITENTRAAYPIQFIDNAKIPCTGPHPRNIVFLTCDAFGVLPPVSRLTPAQAEYHFLSGYTAKVAGTEVGIATPQATFSACFGAAFLVWPPVRYAALLADRMRRHQTDAWLVNTGWSGGAYGVGSRMKLSHTRAILDAIHDGSLAATATETDPVFGLAMPTGCPGVPPEALFPRNTWSEPAAYDDAARKLAGLFRDNFAHVAPDAGDDIRRAGPRI